MLQGKAVEENHESRLSWHVGNRCHLSCGASVFDCPDGSAEECHRYGICKDSGGRIHDGLLAGRQQLQERRKPAATWFVSQKPSRWGNTRSPRRSGSHDEGESKLDRRRPESRRERHACRGYRVREQVEHAQWWL